MIARDLADEIQLMAIRHGRRTSAEILVGMGVAEEELEPLLEIMLRRAELITNPEDGPLDAAGVGWLDGFMVGWALSRRRITL